MAGAKKRIYWDACCFVSYIARDPARFQDLEPIMDEANALKHDLFTSVLSVVEVAFCPNEKQKKQLSEEACRKIGNLWKASSPVKLVELHPLIAEEAQGLLRAKIPTGLRIKPADAIHLATAKHMKVDVIHTYESRWKKWGDVIGIKVEEPKPFQPYLTNEQPREESSEVRAEG